MPDDKQEVLNQGQPEAEEQAGIVAGTERGNSGEAKKEEQERVVQLTEKKLQSLIDKEVTKALKTRTQNLQRELEEARAQAEEYRRKLEEEDLSTVAKLELREREAKELQAQLKVTKKQREALEAEITALVEAELESLSEEDRKVAEAAFPGDAPPLLKLRGFNPHRARRPGATRSSPPSTEDRP